jgi:hypothetical protein
VGAIVAAVVIGIAAVLTGARLLAGQSDPFPDSIREAANFPLYYSRNLPPGFSMPTKNAAKLAGGSATLQYIYQGHTIVLSMQAKPNANLPEPLRLKDVGLAFGHGYVANINGQPAGIIEGDKTLMFITSEDKIDADVIAQFMRSLTPAN